MNDLKHLPLKIIIAVCFILLIMTGYFLAMNISYKGTTHMNEFTKPEVTPTSSPTLTEDPNTTPTASPTLEPTIIPTGFILPQEDKNSIQTYISTNLGVLFKFPESYIIKDTGDSIAVIDSVHNLIFVEISSLEGFLSSTEYRGEINSNDKPNAYKNLDSIKINGLVYQITSTIFGEGFPDSGGYNISYFTKLRDDLGVSLYSFYGYTDSSPNCGLETPENCNSANLTEYITTDKEFETAKDIVESIQPLFTDFELQEDNEAY
ncbi:hypothetical protein KC717_00340 [Candidatus Dojkabacteria bacterium]|uniref:Uncharacterized protein n=1 Tax=Candidatus Dojkabacteria bacterium TaxID=2099670 RepID=A0A955RJT9_9BACT|nr:hypothetical protein [Candidatus Dojkabacteria bacterium]